MLDAGVGAVAAPRPRKPAAAPPAGRRGSHRLQPSPPPAAQPAPPPAPRRRPTAAARQARSMERRSRFCASACRARRCGASRANWASISARVKGSGPKGRILQDDVQHSSRPRSRARAAPRGGGLRPQPAAVAAGRFRQVRSGRTQAAVAHQEALRREPAPQLGTIPHVTQHDEADITELEAFRKSQVRGGEEAGHKLTMLAS